MIVEAQITISRPAAAVWAAITDIRHFTDMIGSVEKTEILNEPASGLVGLKWRETRMYFGKPAAIDKWITEAVENKFYRTRAEMDGFIFLTTLTLSAEGEGTRLSSCHETRSQGFVAKLKSLPMIFFRGVLKKAILQELNDLKAAVERVRAEG